MAVEDKDLLVDDQTFLEKFSTLTTAASDDQTESPEPEVTEPTQEPVAVEAPVATADDHSGDGSVEPTQEETPSTVVEEPSATGEEPTEEETTDTVPDTSSSHEVNYKDFYDKLMAPLRASGKTIQLKSVDEALELIKKGFDYTRKTQEIAPDRKFLAMLEKNGLKDEAKLNYLIDLSNKNPEAIRKLISEAGIDPLDIDTDVPVNYTPGNHAITDTEINFRDVVTELNSAPEGQEVITKVFKGWDQASQGHLWKQPEALHVLAKQKAAGIFDLVETEVERRMTLGQIPAGVSRLDAYRLVGSEMGNAGAFNHLVPAEQNTKQPIASRVATPKPAVSNDESVKAASITQTASAKGKVDKLAAISKMSDEEFLAQFPKLIS